MRLEVPTLAFGRNNKWMCDSSRHSNRNTFNPLNGFDAIVLTTTTATTTPHHHQNKTITKNTNKKNATFSLLCPAPALRAVSVACELSQNWKIVSHCADPHRILLFAHIFHLDCDGRGLCIYIYLFVFKYFFSVTRKTQHAPHCGTMRRICFCLYHYYYSFCHCNALIWCNLANCFVYFSREQPPSAPAHM